MVGQGGGVTEEGEGLTTIPGRVSICRNRGTAVILLDLPPATTWTSAGRCSAAQELTRCRGDWAPLLTADDDAQRQNLNVPQGMTPCVPASEIIQGLHPPGVVPVTTASTQLGAKPLRHSHTPYCNTSHTTLSQMGLSWEAP